MSAALATTVQVARTQCPVLLVHIDLHLAQHHKMIVSHAQQVSTAVVLGIQTQPRALEAVTVLLDLRVLPHATLVIIALLGQPVRSHVLLEAPVLLGVSHHRHVKQVTYVLVGTLCQSSALKTTTALLPHRKL